MTWSWWWSASPCEIPGAEKLGEIKKGAAEIMSKSKSLVIGGGTCAFEGKIVYARARNIVNLIDEVNSGVTGGDDDDDGGSKMRQRSGDRDDGGGRS
jgi:hypothetical protein